MSDRSRIRSADGAASVEGLVFGPAMELSPGPLGAVQAADREIARQTAARARALAEFAAARPASADRRQGENGAMSAERWAARPELLRPVSEWAAAELSIALSITTERAETELAQALSLVSRLPGALVALEAGMLHVGHLWPLLDHVAPIHDDRVRAEVEAELLRWVAARAAARTTTTPPRLRDKARCEVIRRNARDAADELARAIKQRGVFLRADKADGLATLGALLTLPEAQACLAALDALVDALPADPADPRTRGQKRADVLLDLVLRPGESAHPPVQVALTLVASVNTVLGGDAPAELDGQVVPAEVARQLLRLLTGTDLATASDTAETDTAEAPAAGPADEWLRGEPFTAEDLALIELAEWWDRTEQRVLAGELDDMPPVPSEVLAAWPGDPDEMFETYPWDPDDLVAPGPCDEIVDIPARTDAASAAQSRPDGSRRDDPPSDDPPPEEGGGWWAAADRAVGDASAALFRAEQALGRAGRMVRTAAWADTADEQAWSDSTAGHVDRATDALAALAAAATEDRAALGALLARTGGGGLADRPRIALVDALSGALVALTDLPGLRRAGHCGAPACRRRPQRCEHDLGHRPGLGAPGSTDAYRPSATLDRYVRGRDRRCRFPGCRRRVPQRGELDHGTRWPDGPTSAANLAGYCTPHHRGKHQAPGLIHRLDPDGTLTVTTPTGLAAVTTPPPY